MLLSIQWFFSNIFCFGHLTQFYSEYIHYNLSRIVLKCNILAIGKYSWTCNLRSWSRVIYKHVTWYQEIEYFIKVSSVLVTWSDLLGAILQMINSWEELHFTRKTEYYSCSYMLFLPPVYWSSVMRHINSWGFLSPLVLENCCLNKKVSSSFNDHRWRHRICEGRKFGHRMRKTIVSHRTLRK